MLGPIGSPGFWRPCLLDKYIGQRFRTVKRSPLDSHASNFALGEAAASVSGLKHQEKAAGTDSSMPIARHSLEAQPCVRARQGARSRESRMRAQEHGPGDKACRCRAARPNLRGGAVRWPVDCYDQIAVFGA